MGRCAARVVVNLIALREEEKETRAMTNDRRDVFRECEEADKEVRAGPHAWIQWKGTNVCMDVHCSCGGHTHVDADFAYYVRCGDCGRLWAMCANVRMLPVEEKDIEGRCPPIVST